eukprot:gene16151-19218_t
MDNNSFASKIKAVQTKLETPHSIVQQEAVLQLDRLIQQEQAPSSRFDQLLQQIIDLLHHQSSIVTETAVYILKKLHLNKRIDRKRLLDALLNAVPSLYTRNEGSIDLVIVALVDAAVEVDAIAETKITSSPLLALVRDSKEAVVCSLIENIERVLGDTSIPGSISEQRWRVLNPSITAILVANQPTLGAQLTTALVRVAHNNRFLYTPIVAYLSSVLFVHPFSPSSSIFHDQIDLARFPPSGPLASDRLLLAHTRLAYLFTQTFLLARTNAATATSMLTNLTEIIALDRTLAAELWRPIVHSLATQVIPIPAILAYLLPTAISRHSLIILPLLGRLLDDMPSTAYSRATLHLLVFPLVRVASSSSESLSTPAKLLLKRVEIAIAQGPQSDPSTPLNLDVVVSEQLTPINTAWQWFLSLCSNPDDEQASDYFSSLHIQLQDRLSSKNTNSDIELIMLFWAPLLSTMISPSSRVQAAQSTKLITGIDSISSPSLLPLFIARLNTEEYANVVMAIYRAMPYLATHRLCQASVARTLCALDSHPNLAPTALRLVGQLAEVNDRSFSTLHTRLLSLDVATASLEQRIASAACIRDVCMRDGDRGQELISPLSALLTRDTHPSVLALALDSLTALCRGGVLAFTSAWTVIRKNLGIESGHDADKRAPLVLVHLLEFFSCGVDDVKDTPVDIMEEKRRDIMLDIIRRIWALYRHTDVKVSGKAMRVLGAYAAISLLLVAGDSASIPRLIDYIHSDGSDELLKSALTHELSEKRTLKSAHANLRQTKAIRLGEGIADIPTMLLSELESATRPGIRQGVLGGLLWSLGVSQSGSDQSSKPNSKKEIALRFKAFSTILNDALSGLDTQLNSRDLVAKIMPVGAWLRFMGECLPASIKNETTKASLAGETSNPREITERVFDRIYSTLLAHVTKAPSSVEAENSVLAMAGLARSMPQTSYIKIEQVLTQLCAWIDNNNADEAPIAAACMAAGLVLPQMLDDSPLLNTTVELLKKAAIDRKYSQPSHFSAWITLGNAATSLASGASTVKRAIAKQVIDQVNDKAALLDAASSDLESLEGSAPGILLALGYASPAMDATQVNRAHATMATLLSCDSPQLVSACLLALPNVLARGLKLSVVSTDVIETMLDRFNSLESTNRQNKQLSLVTSVGNATLMQAMATADYKLDLTIIEKALTNSLNGLAAVDSSATRLSSMMSGAILIGAPLLSLDSSKLVTSALDLMNSQPARRKDTQKLVDDLIGRMRSVFAQDTDSRVAKSAAWCLGGVTAPPSSQTNAAASNDTPDNLDHLAGDSLTKALFNTILVSSSQSQLARVLGVFSHVDGTKLPIVNWGGVLKRVFASTQDVDVRIECVRFSTANIALSTCSINMAEWISVAQFESLTSTPLRKELLLSIPKVITHIPASRIPSIIDELVGGVARGEIPSMNVGLGWKVVRQCLENCTGDVLSRCQKLAISLIPSLPSPIECLEGEWSMVNGNLDVLDQAIKTLIKLPATMLQTNLVVPLQASKAEDVFVNECKINYLYAHLLIGGTPGAIPMSQVNRLKSWCFSIVESAQKRVARPLLHHLLVKQLTQGINSSSAPQLSVVVFDLLDSLKLSLSQSMGLELLSQILSSTRSQSSISNVITTTQLENTIMFGNSLDGHSSLLAHQLSSGEHGIDRNEISIRMLSLLKEKPMMDMRSKSIVIKSIIALTSFKALPFTEQIKLIDCGNQQKELESDETPEAKRRWTIEEDQIIMDKRLELGNKWTAISHFLNGRTPTDIKNRWNNTLQHRVPWTIDEDQLIIDLYVEYRGLENPWIKMTPLIDGRNTIAIKKRFYTELISTSYYHERLASGV